MEGLKTRLMVEAARAIDELLSKKSSPDKITLRETKQSPQWASAATLDAPT